MKKPTKSRKSKIPKLDVNMKKRLTIFWIVSCILLVGLTLRISYLQFAPTVAGRNLREEAQRQQMAIRPITPRRGNLLDSTR